MHNVDEPSRSLEERGSATDGAAQSRRPPAGALIGGLAAVLVLLLAVGAWPRWTALREARAQAGAEKAPKVVYVLAKRGNGGADLGLPASVHAFQQATLYARTSGYVSRIHADIGDQVRAGQLLAEIDVPELDRELQQVQAARAQAKANLELARVTAGRYAALIGEDAVSPQEADEKRGIYEARRADLEAVEANLRRLEQLKAYQRVVAPFAGTVTERNVDVGMLIQAGSASASGWLYKLSQTGTLRVHVNVPQNQLKMVQPGMSADLYIPGLSDQAFPAKVARVSGAFDNASRTMLVELHVSNPDGRILPGMYGQVRFRLVNPTPNLVIPVTALMVTGDGLRVATVDAQDAVHIATVEVGRDHGKQVEILKGLSDNQRVINNPRDTLTEGVKVRPVPQEEDSAKAAPPGAAPPGAAPPATPPKTEKTEKKG
jgi:membrane fusion protein, multidrug efflux system